MRKTLIGVVIAALVGLTIGVATAKIVAKAAFPSGGVLLLHNEQGPCEPGWQLGEYQYPNQGKKIKGCWVVHPNGTAIFFKDEEGDAGLIPIPMFEPLKDI